MKRFIRRGDVLVMTLHPAEVAVLRDLAAQVDELLAGGLPEHGADPVRDRLFPRAYLDPTEDEAETDFQAMVHEDLVRAKSQAVAALVASLDVGREGRDEALEVRLDPEQVAQWVGALNDLRLALGVALGVTEEMPEVAAEDPRAPGLELYGWLTYLQGELVEQLLGGDV